jgi:hypothetical protein
MSLIIIDINDSEIRAGNQDEIISRNPGYAILKADKIETGANAWKASRTNPRETSNKFWSQLNQDSLTIPSRLARHNADLAFTQLMAIYEEAGQPEEVIFAIPGSYNREHLSLLLGIVESCPFSAIGLIDSAIASTSAIADSGEYLHMDIHLHYTILTTIDVTDSVYRKTVKIIDSIGISEIYDTCAEYLSDLFIDQTRFDPLHHAETEQILYNLIPETLANLDIKKENNLDIHFQGKHFQIKLSPDTLLKKLQFHYEKIYTEISGQQTSLISDRLNVLPGFSEQVNNHVVIDENTVFKGCFANMNTIITTGEGLSLITSLPTTTSPSIIANTATIETSQSATRTLAKPTHVLIENKAYLLEKSPIYISQAGKISRHKNDRYECSLHINDKGAEIIPESNNTVSLNSNAITTNNIVEIGDTISISGSDITIKCIEVLTN